MKKVVLTLVAVLSLGLATTADALILSGTVTGGTSLTRDGATFVNLGAGFSGTTGADNFNAPDLYAFDEDQNVTLGAGLTADIGSNLTAGQTVSSHYIFFDPENFRSIVGTVLFDAPILAVMTSSGNLAASDILWNDNTTYVNLAGRDLEQGDALSINAGNSALLDIELSALSPGDFIRVITQGQGQTNPNPVPEPMSMTLFGAGLAGAALRRKFNI